LALAVLVAALSLGLILGLGVTREGNIWTELTPQGALPPARGGHDTVLDSSAGLLIVFGGKGEITGHLNDTWAYDPLANTWGVLALSGAQPEARYDHAMAYDEAVDKIIMFGGYSGSENMTGDYHDDTWAYDAKANAWTKLEPSGAAPPARAGHTMAYDPGLHRMILFGGELAWVALDDTWAYDPTINTWTELTPAGSPPAGRWGAAMTYDSTSDRIVMFGGIGDRGVSFSDTWSYDASKNRWTELNSETHPAPRFNARMAYDPSTERVLMFGGTSPQGPRSDTWVCTP